MVGCLHRSNSRIVGTSSPSGESLRRFIEQKVFPCLETQRKELSNRPLIREQAFGESPAVSAPLYVDMMGGAEKILARGRELHDEGQYLLASEIVNKLVQAEPDNEAAKDLLADIFEQIG